MSVVLLLTKLYIPPPRINLVLRTRLIGLLNKGLSLGCKLTLISAPAGFGKTTLVSEWVAGYVGSAAWLSLDEGDNDPTHFLTYLVAALQTIVPNIGAGVLGLLQSPQPTPTESILTALLNEITTVPDDFILVLDDYHVIDAKPVENALTFLIEHLPPKMHLVIATREDPNLPLARLRGRDQLTELRVTDLRFSPSEATEFLNQVMGLNLTEADITALEARTEGWIVGLQLAALALQGATSIQGHKDAASFIKNFTGSHNFVMDYLVEEVLQLQSERIQGFLLCTSILDRLCGPLCDAVLYAPSAYGQETTGQETLEYLERANLLVIPLDDKREWYRYHHLFADVLQACLMKKYPSQIADLHLRACTWYEQHNFLSDAIRHALAAEEFERAADLIEPMRSVMRENTFQSTSWLSWVKALPDEVVRVRPMLNIGYAWELLFLGELEASEIYMSNADRLLNPTENINNSAEATMTSIDLTNKEEIQSQKASLALARAFHGQALGNVVGTIKHAQQALIHVPETDFQTRGIAGSLLGLAYLTSGDLVTADKYMTDAITFLRTAGNLDFATSGIFVLGDIRIAQGRIFDAISCYEQELQLVLNQGESELLGTAELRLGLHLGLAELFQEIGNLSDARKHLLRSEELAKHAMLPTFRYSLILAQARMKETDGDLENALKLLNQAEPLYYRTPLPDVRPIAALKARVWIRLGRLNEALGWARGRKLSVEDDLSYMREFEHVTLARVLIARYQSSREERSIHQAVGLMDRLLKAADDGERMGSVIEILVLQALAHQAQGNISATIMPLQHALSLAEPEGYVRLFVNEGKPMAQLLSELAALGIMPEYIGKLLAILESEEQKGAHKSNLSFTQPHIDQLSLRELEILQLIAQGLSNHEISERLFLAIPTVKGHNRNIFAKLSVQRRTEAIVRARELGLL